jgi:hypothetical protein
VQDSQREAEKVGLKVLAMLWTEMIRLKTLDPGAEGLNRLLLDAMKHVAKEPGLVEAKAYRSALQPNELALSLMWDTGSPEPKGSRAGLCISEELRAFGLVVHSVWIEIPENRP